MQPANTIDAIHFYRELPRGVIPRFVRHDEAHWCWRALLVVAFMFRLRHRWVTVGSTIYYPTRIDSYDFMKHSELQQMHWVNKHLPVIAHEFVHVAQWHHLGWFGFLALYFVLPLPLFFSGRWFIERSAFLIQVRHFGMTVGEAVTALCSKSYGWCCPRKWAVEWFEEHK